MFYVRVRHDTRRLDVDRLDLLTCSDGAEKRQAFRSLAISEGERKRQAPGGERRIGGGQRESAINRAGVDRMLQSPMLYALARRERQGRGRPFNE
jgi:hypothetical protein